jgi:mono/diheme cytochrome c family protein
MLVIAPALGLACTKRSDAPAAAEADRWSEVGMLAEGARFVDDGAFRRAALVESLTNPDNIYSRQRLSNYGLRTKGWDLLPEWNPKSVVLTVAAAEEVRAGKRPELAAETPPLWDGVRPTTVDGWAALGREVFFRYPLRSEVFVEWGLAHPDAGARVGVRAADDGSYPGVVLFVDTKGDRRVGMTCAMCHTDVVDGQAIVGQARRAFDYGALRLAYHAATGTAVDPDLARRMRTWGPGRADVTEDDDEDPVAIPDLWGLRHETFLTHAGTIKHAGPAALAIRQETQLLTSNHQTVRPPRELAFALAMFLYALKPPAAPALADASRVASGKALFRDRCAGCHSNAAGGGGLESAERIGTDRTLANGKARGTGRYRNAPLTRVAAAAPFFHDGSVPTLEDVLSPERLAPTYARGTWGKGPVPGHDYGLDLSSDDRSALVAFLRAL